MKIACDVCEKVEDECKTNDWLGIVVNGRTKYLFCEECEKKFWKIFKDAEQLLEELKTYRETKEITKPVTEEVISKAVEALEKQIPQAIKKVYAGEDGIAIALCPKCHYVIHREEKYCHKCGQAIKWK